MKITAKELSEKHGVDAVVANSVLRFLAQKGIAKISETRPSASGKGKPTNVYEMADSVTLDL